MFGLRVLSLPSSVCVYMHVCVHMCVCVWGWGGVGGGGGGGGGGGVNTFACPREPFELDSSGSDQKMQNTYSFWR